MALLNIWIKPRTTGNEVAASVSRSSTSSDRTGDGQQLADLLTIKARPEDAQRVSSSSP